MNEPITFTHIILSRYCGQFTPATEETATIRKTSEDIMLDLRPMVTVSTNEIAEYMVSIGYSIGFDDATPVWLMKTDRELELRE